MPMNTPKTTNVKLSKEEIQTELQEALEREEHLDLVAEAILNLVPDDRDRSLLFLATTGQRPKSDFRIDEKVLIKSNMIPSSYRHSLALYNVKELNDDWIEGVMTEFKPWLEKCYIVKITFAGPRTFTMSIRCTPDEVISSERWPE